MLFNFSTVYKGKWVQNIWTYMITLGEWRAERIDSPNPQNGWSALLLEAETKNLYLFKTWTWRSSLFFFWTQKYAAVLLVVILVATGSWGLEWGTQGKRRKESSTGSAILLRKTLVNGVSDHYTYNTWVNEIIRWSIF